MFESRDVGNVGRAGGCWGLIGILGCGHTRMVVPFVAIAVVAANLLLCVLSCDRKRRLLLRLSQRVYVHMCVCVRVSFEGGVDGWLRSDVTHGCKGFSLMMLSLMVHGRSSAQLGWVRFGSISHQFQLKLKLKLQLDIGRSLALLANFCQTSILRIMMLLMLLPHHIAHSSEGYALKAGLNSSHRIVFKTKQQSNTF